MPLHVEKFFLFLLQVKLKENILNRKHYTFPVADTHSFFIHILIYRVLSTIQQVLNKPTELSYLKRTLVILHNSINLSARSLDDPFDQSSGGTLQQRDIRDTPFPFTIIKLFF